MNAKLLLGIAIIISLIVIPPVSADESVLVNGTFYYRNITPQNDIYKKVVMPGDTIALGRTYDLTYVSGTSKKFAWWSNWKIEGSTCTPDIIINTSYIDTGGKTRPNNVTLDPGVWRVGNWFQWDGCYETQYQKGQSSSQLSVYRNDNNLMFHVIYDPNPPTPVPTTIITTIPTIITTQPTTIPVTTSVPIPKKDEGWPWWVYVLGGTAAVLGVKLLW